MPAIRLNVSPVTTSQPPQSEQRRPADVGARRPADRHQPGDQQDQRRRQQPGDLAADLGGEQPAEPGRAPLPAGPPGRRRRRCRSRRRSAGRGRCSPRSAPTPSWSASRRCRAAPTAGTSSTIATHQPPATTIAAPGGEQVHRSAGPAWWAPPQVDQREAGDDEQRLQRLGQERQTDQHADADQPAQAGLLDGPRRWRRRRTSSAA